MKNSVRQKEVREAILDATDLLLSRYGYQKMTIDDLAREVGIGKGSVYLHFTSKEEIVLSHIDRIIEQLKGKLSAIAKSAAPADRRIKEILLTRVLHRFDSVQHYTQSLNDLLAVLRPKVLARRETYFDAEIRILAAVIREGQESKVFAAGDSSVMAETLILATNSLLPFSLSAQELGAREDIESKTRRIAEMLLTGLSRREKE